MKISKPGDPCPLCGQPLRDGLPTKTMIYLSWLAEGLALREAITNMEKDQNGQI